MTEKINMKVMQYSKEYWEELKNNNSDATLNFGECLVNIETREVVKDNRK